MKNPDKESKNSKKKLARGIAINAPNLNGRIQKRANKRLGVSQAHGGHTQSAIYLEAGSTQKRNYNGQEVRGGGAIKYW